jgi:gliding motility-associated-like protein
VGQRDTFKLDIAEMQGKVVGVKRIPVAGSAGEYADIQLIDGSYSIVCEAIEEGTDAVSFVLVDQDGIADTTRIEVKVYSRAATPTAVDDQVRIAKNTVAMINPEQNDVLVGKTNVVRLLSAPAHGTVQVMKDGMVMYTPNANFTGKDELVYELCNEAGCAQARILFNVEGNGMVVYNAFSPNGDGTNDSFTIQNIEQYPNNELQIFNRWGEAILNVKGYKNDWKGTWNDRDLPDGTYFYILEDGFGNKNSGFIELKR